MFWRLINSIGALLAGLYSQIYYVFKLMRYYLWTTFTPGGDPCQRNFQNEKLTNKINFIAMLPELISPDSHFNKCNALEKKAISRPQLSAVNSYNKRQSAYFHI